MQQPGTPTCTKCQPGGDSAGDPPASVYEQRLLQEATYSSWAHHGGPAVTTGGGGLGQRSLSVTTQAFIETIGSGLGFSSAVTTKRKSGLYRSPAVTTGRWVVWDKGAPL